MSVSKFRSIPTCALPLVSMATMTLGGCATLPSSGPTAGSIERSARSSDTPLRFDIVELDAATVEQLSRVQVAPDAAVPTLSHLARDYQADLIGPGDVLDISVYEVGVSLFGGGGVRVTGNGFDPSARGERFPPITVDAAGTIALPYIGSLRVTGRTTTQVQREIEAALASKSQAPRALVAVRDNVSNTVYISGDIRRPGRVPLTLNRERLLDAVASAGGSVSPVGDSVVRFSRGDRMIEQRLGDIRPGSGDDLLLIPADRVELVREPRSFVVFGATNKVSQVPFDTGAVTLAEAIARVGGPSDAVADPSAIFLFRYDSNRATEGARPVLYRLNMLKPASYFLSQRVAMRDKDVLYIANARANQPAKLFGILNLLFSPFITARQIAN